MKVNEFIGSFNRIDKELQNITSKIVVASMDNNIEEVQKQTEIFIKVRDLKWELEKLSFKDMKRIIDIFDELRFNVY